MSRALAVFLLVVGILLNVIGILVIVVAAVQLPRGGMGPLFAGLAVEVVGVALLVAGIVGLRRARLASSFPPGGGDGPIALHPQQGSDA